MAPAPCADQLPRFPASWYFFCSAQELRRGPRSRDVLGRRLVAFRTRSGRIVVLDAHCSHLGADLGRGCVIGENVRCSFHHWQYGPDGQCEHIPATSDIPATAGQTCYPAVERHGFVFFFSEPVARFPFPFFPSAEPEDFAAARPFGATLQCPWFLIGANAFDLQHFLVGHDRRLISEPKVDCPAGFARSGIARFAIAGNSLQDHVTRWFAGDEVEMSITDWCGTMMFVTATFLRTRTYGMVTTEPLAAGGVLVRVFVFARRSRSWLGRICRDPLHLAIRRLFVLNFLRADAARLDGIRYHPAGLIPEDEQLADYLRWLAKVSRGRPVPVHQTAAVAATRDHCPIAVP